MKNQLLITASSSFSEPSAELIQLVLDARIKLSTATADDPATVIDLLAAVARCVGTDPRTETTKSHAKARISNYLQDQHEDIYEWMANFYAEDILTKLLSSE